MNNTTPASLSNAASIEVSYPSYANLSVYKGKAVMKGYQNALNKLANAGILPRSQPAIMANAFSGMEKEIHGFAWSICNIILFVAHNNLIGRLFAVLDDNGKQLGTLRLTQQDFDNLRHFLNVHESAIYYDFID